MTTQEISQKIRELYSDESGSIMIMQLCNDASIPYNTAIRYCSGVLKRPSKKVVFKIEEALKIKELKNCILVI